MNPKSQDGNAPTAISIASPDTPLLARQHLLEVLRREVLGPESDVEILQESPLTRYITGVLGPFGTEVPEEERDEELANGDEEEVSPSMENGPPLAQSLTPSSIGLSFLLPAKESGLTANASWGEYALEPEGGESESLVQVAPETLTDNSGEKPHTSKRRPRLTWKRTPYDHGPIALSLSPDAGLQRIRIGNTGLTIEHVARTIGNYLAVSLFLVNRRPRNAAKKPPLDKWIFQPLIVVHGKGTKAVFLPREMHASADHLDPDQESNQLLYGSRREYATGHGCAADWEVEPGEQRARSVRSELVPAYELPRVAARGEAHKLYSMKALADARSAQEVRDVAQPLLDEYARWIEDKRGEGSQLRDDLRRVATVHLDECERALSRMAEGLAVIERDDETLQAFRFANRAMLLQRSHALWSSQRRKDPATAPANPEMTGSWRPFQLAFFLMNIGGVALPESEDRKLGDLLWFPTGGGKTEAYLGLAAFAMALRRRRSLAGMRTDAGVAVLMRYTLRLLTIQQFQRASILLCACEFVRRKDPARWGDYRFSIGLWLGQSGTPNSHDDSRQALTRLQVDPSEEGGNPCVLESCPWCGEPLHPRNYWIDAERRRTLVACPRPSCAFSRENGLTGIPVVVVDEEIYRECPTLLLATVDKFAQMPWNAEVQSLFGFVDRECDRCGFLTPSTEHRTHKRGRGFQSDANLRPSERLAPPDVIIQDELHLISGPLGTLVGLYESAVDFLASRRVHGRWVRPKVLASTATVRRAFEQVQAIFDRSLRVFPPPGLDATDSFFAVEEQITLTSPGRVYVGVCAPGRSMKTAYIRIASSLLSSAAGLRANPTVAEPYLTLVSYFNSLRELGGARRLLDDDIPARLDQLRTLGKPHRSRPIYDELTSRARQEAIPRLLRRLEQRHDQSRSTMDAPPLDVVLASSMISVGVDIDRLGLMTVTGQPKTTAEYVQATSRVGRQSWGPGLVIAIYNWSRPRDLSHYERFRHYHSTLYRSVEAVSATPFSSRALDRGLRGVFVSMARLGSGILSPELGASLFDPATPRIDSIAESLRARSEGIAGPAIGTMVATAVQALADEWWGFKRKPLRYGWRTPNTELKPAEDVLLQTAEARSIGHWPAPQSLREVEDLSYVRLLGLHGQT